jgi:2-dehydropantoate 2-reductase
MRILVIGAGAVGGYFGARLAAAGRDVTFLVREKRAEQLRSTGLMVTEPEAEFTVQPKLLVASELHAKPETFDLILLSTKAYSLNAAIDDFAPAVGDHTAILPLLNGMKHLDALIARFGEGAVLGGSTRISATLDDDGRVISMDKQLHDLHFGERDKQVTERIQAIDQTLKGCNFDAELEPDILAFMWNKWTILSALAAITCTGRLRRLRVALKSSRRCSPKASPLPQQTATLRRMCFSQGSRRGSRNGAPTLRPPCTAT